MRLIPFLVLVAALPAAAAGFPPSGEDGLGGFLSVRGGISVGAASGGGSRLVGPAGGLQLGMRLPVRYLAAALDLGLSETRSGATSLELAPGGPSRSFAPTLSVAAGSLLLMGRVGSGGFSLTGFAGPALVSANAALSGADQQGHLSLVPGMCVGGEVAYDVGAGEVLLMARWLGASATPGGGDPVNVGGTDVVMGWRLFL